MDYFGRTPDGDTRTATDEDEIMSKANYGVRDDERRRLTILDQAEVVGSCCRSDKLDSISRYMVRHSWEDVPAFRPTHQEQRGVLLPSQS